jgi:hypothetical protein
MRSLPVKFAVALAFFSLSVLAQPARTFISAATGDDLNACSLASPCRNLARGVAAVAASGEVVALDSGGYGVATISKSVTVAIPAGVYAGVTALTSGVSGITIDTAGVDVKLRGLSINALGGSSGISVPAVQNVALNVERSTISGFPTAGVLFNSAGGRLLVIDSLIRDNFTGVDVSSGDSGNVAHAMIEHSHFSGNGGLNSGAVNAGANTQMSVHDSVANGNFRGFQVTGGPAFTEMTVEDCAATGNVVGVFGTGGGGQLVVALMYVSNSLIAHNTLFAIEAQGGSGIYTRGNNTVIDNAAAETFTGPYSPK